MVFDLVLPLSLEIGLDPVAALGLTKCGQAGWRAMKKTEGSPMLPGWKQLAVYLLQRALLCHHLSCVCPPLPGGNGSGRWSPFKAVREYPAYLTPQGLSELEQEKKAGVMQGWRKPFGNWAAWTGLSWPPADFPGRSLRGTEELPTRKQPLKPQGPLSCLWVQSHESHHASRLNEVSQRGACQARLETPPAIVR